MAFSEDDECDAEQSKAFVFVNSCSLQQHVFRVFLISLSLQRGREVVSLAPGLTAAALQDHLIRQLSLSNPLPPHKTHTPSRKSAQHTSSWKSVGKKRNTKTDSVLRDREDENERLLDPTPQPLSLAEKLGLVPGPRPQLSTSEWETAKCSSRERRDSSQPCPICHEEFGTRQQVRTPCEWSI